MTILSNSIKLPPALARKAVVTVNEVPPRGFPTGHIDLSFFWYGIFQGTFGRNSQGVDVAGRLHRQGPPNLFKGGSMPGGVFTEPNSGVIPHFVIVSDKNYFSMLAYAQSQAKSTAQGKGLDYNIFSGNCSDFAYRVFQHSDLPERFRFIDFYLKDHDEAVAIYAEDERALYSDKSKKWTHNQRLIQRGATIIIDTERLKEKVNREVFGGI